MTGYELLARLKKARRKSVLTATEQALYHELGMQANEVEWDDIFSCSNDELCVALSISENTLINARQSLIQCGLIFYRSGKSRRKYGDYSFEKDLTTSKFEVTKGVNASAIKGVNAEVVTGVNASANAADYNKHKLNSNKNQTSEDKSSGPAASKKSVSKKKDLGETTEHWPQLVEIWFEFYKANPGKGEEPTFDGQAPAT